MNGPDWFSVLILLNIILLYFTYGQQSINRYSGMGTNLIRKYKIQIPTAVFDDIG